MSLDIGERLSSAKFPECVTQGLQKLEEIIKLPSSPKLHNLQQQIIEEYILNYHDSSSNQKQIGAIEELMIVRSIAQYLAIVFDPATRNSLFNTLFPAVSNENQTPFKIRILSSLVSLSVTTHNIAVLDATAVWMQQVSCFSVRACRVSYSLIQDFFQSNVKTPQHFLKALKSIPGATPLFTANLITSLAQVYAKIGRNELCDEPPIHLVQIIIEWLKTNPLILLTPLTTSLPGISLPMTSILAIAPLTKWCIEAPYFSLLKNTSCNDNAPCYDAFSELHLLLLQTLQNVSSIRSHMTQREVICAEHMKCIADVLCLRIATKENSPSPQVKETSLNRFAQIILVALHTNCLSGRLAEMWNSLQKLPKTPRLMRTLLSSNPC